MLKNGVEVDFQIAIALDGHENEVSEQSQKKKIVMIFDFVLSVLYYFCHIIL